MTPLTTNSRARLGVGTLLVVLFAFTATPAMGQMGGVDFKPGVRAGVNFMTLGGDNTDNLDRRTGFLAGAFVQLDFAGPFALQPEITYTQKGASADVQGTEVTRKLDYIEIPVLAKYQIPAGVFSPNIFAGPAVGFNASAEDSNGNSVDISDNISGTEFGLYFGAGADFGLGAGTISVDARYNLGLTNVLDVDGDTSQNNQGFMITAGFAF